MIANSRKSLDELTHTLNFYKSLIRDEQPSVYNDDDAVRTAQKIEGGGIGRTQNQIVRPLAG
jgi:hypothetical protein